MCWSYNRQYGTSYLAAMPTNLYGPGDNYHPTNSHVIPALLRKFHEAKQRGDANVTVWGTGTPRREFLYSDDMADACVFLMERYEGSEIVNIGTGEEVTIRELTNLVAQAVGYTGEVRWDRTKPDGMERKLLDVSRLHGMGWRHRTTLEEGLRLTLEDYAGHLAHTAP